MASAREEGEGVVGFKGDGRGVEGGGEGDGGFDMESAGRQVKTPLVCGEGAGVGGLGLRG